MPAYLKIILPKIIAIIVGLIKLEYILHLTSLAVEVVDRNGP